LSEIEAAKRRVGFGVTGAAEDVAKYTAIARERGLL
jgi:hypothetical protein